MNVPTFGISLYSYAYMEDGWLRTTIIVFAAFLVFYGNYLVKKARERE